MPVPVISYEKPLQTSSSVYLPAIVRVVIGPNPWSSDRSHLYDRSKTIEKSFALYRRNNRIVHALLANILTLRDISGVHWCERRSWGKPLGAIFVPVPVPEHMSLEEAHVCCGSYVHW